MLTRILTQIQLRHTRLCSILRGSQNHVSGCDPAKLWFDEQWVGFDAIRRRWNRIC